MRYEFTKPLIHATLLERDVEVSQWGGNLATEERYWLTNRGANLKNQFSRVAWAASQYYNPPTSAIKELKVPLKVGSLDPYFTDDIGNVSTSRFRSNVKEANLELKPRYPVFGGWKYSFRIGWDANLKDSLRKMKNGDGYILKVPFLEGPKMPEGVSYEKVEVRVILPEGATNVKFETAVPLVADEILSHKTFMDTLGRTMLKLTAMNVVDASRDQDLVVSLVTCAFTLAYFDTHCFFRPLWNDVARSSDHLPKPPFPPPYRYIPTTCPSTLTIPTQITYDYPFTAAFRKPITIFLGVLSVFVTAWVIKMVDTSIGK